MNVPDDYYMISSESVENEVLFVKNDYEDNDSQIVVEIYSKSDVGTASELAKKDYDNNKKTLNENVATFGDVVEKGYENFRGWEYGVTIDAISAKYVGRDVFFELGDYVYNVNIKYQTPNNLGESMTNAILNSIEIKEIDSSKVGILMRNIPDYEGTFTVSQDKWSLVVPNSYSEVARAEDGVMMENMLTGTAIIFQTGDADGMSAADTRLYLKDMETEMKKQQGKEIIQSPKQVTIGGMQYYELIYMDKSYEDEVHYVRHIIGLKGGNYVLFSMSFYELGYSKYCIAETDEIVKSLTIKR